MNLVEKDKKHVWHPFTQHFTAEEPLPIVKAEGVYLYDADGKSYIDANASWWVNTHGHAHPYIGEAMAKQFKEVDHIVFAGTTHPKAAELAERITKVLPDHFQKVFFSDNGSTAVEIALKMVMQFWYNKGVDKKRFLAIKGSYHGDTFGAMSLGARGYFNRPFEPYFFDADFLEFPTKDNQEEMLERAKTFFETGEFAGMIVEPLIQGAAGMRMYDVAFLDALTKLAKENDVMVIFDEVMTGFGKTGKLFAMDHCEYKPDFVAMSKGLTAGVMALGLTVTTNEVFDAFLGEETTKALLHGHSFTANPIACAVACANLDLFEREETWKGIEQLVEWNAEFAKELASRKVVKNIRQSGAILAFEVDSGEATGYFSDVKTAAYQYFLERGVLLRPLGNVLFVNPPFCITREEYMKVKEAIDSFLDELL